MITPIHDSNTFETEHIVIITRKGEKHETAFSDLSQARRFAIGMRNMPGFGRPDNVELIERNVAEAGDE